jgi:multisubunit Na+/H+ antiporter MnhG subunit
VRDALSTALLIAGTAAELLACLGVVRMRGALDRLHYAGALVPATLCIAAAVLVREGPSVIGNKALAIAAFTLIGTPVLTHATARAIRAEERE